MSDTTATGALVETTEEDPDFTSGAGENTTLGDQLMAEMERRHGSDEDASGDNPVASESGEEETPPAPPSTEEGEQEEEKAAGPVDANLEQILGDPEPEPVVEASSSEPEPVADEGPNLVDYLRIRLGREPSIEEMEALIQASAQQQPVQQPAYEEPVQPQGPDMREKLREAMIQKYGPEGAELADTLGEALIDFVSPLQERVDAAESALQSQMVRAQEESQQALVKQIDAGYAEFQTAHPELKEVELQAMIARIGDSGQWPALLNQYGGDGSAAVQAALDIQYMTDPELRRRLIDTELAARESDAAKGDDKNDRWSQVAGDGGQTPSRPSTVTEDSEPDNMVDFIRQSVLG